MSMPNTTPGRLSRCQAITDIIESVASEQAALANILYAEGEKIDKVLTLSGVKEDKILPTNMSVKNMVDSITRLEMLLDMKLELFKDCVCDCEDDHDDYK